MLAVSPPKEPSTVLFGEIVGGRRLLPHPFPPKEVDRLRGRGTRPARRSTARLPTPCGTEGGPRLRRPGRSPPRRTTGPGRRGKTARNTRRRTGGSPSPPPGGRATPFRTSPPPPEGGTERPR